MDTLSYSSVQTLSLHWSHNSISLSLAFSHLLFFQRHKFTYKTFEELISWPLLQILLLLSLYLRSSILLLSFLSLLFSLSFILFSSSFIFPILFPLVYFILPLFSLSSSASTTLVLPTSVSTAFHTLLDTLLSLLLLFFSQSQDCDMLAIVFSKLLSTYILQSYLSLFFPYILDNKCLLLLYV